jgi:hypothetical protein
MFITILYIVFLGFSSMVPIIHVQIMYNVHKQLTTIYMIFVYVTGFLWALQAAKPTPSVLLKTDRFIGFLSGLLIQFKIFTDLNFVPVFNRFCPVLVKPTKTCLIQFLGLCRFFELWSLHRNSANFLLFSWNSFLFGTHCCRAGPVGGGLGSAQGPQNPRALKCIFTIGSPAD